MKKIVLFFAAVLFIVPLNLQADDEGVGNPAVEAVTQTSKNDGQLLNLDTSRASSRIDELAQDVQDLQRNVRDQNDRINNLERAISDLRRDRR